MNKVEMNKVLLHPCTVFTVTDEIKLCSSLFSSSALFDTVKTVNIMLDGLLDIR